MIVHNLSLTSLPADRGLLIGAGVYGVVMITLCILGLASERRHLRSARQAQALDQQRKDALAAPYIPNFTAQQLTAADDTNSRRAIARDSQKGSTHE